MAKQTTEKTTSTKAPVGKILLGGIPKDAVLEELSGGDKWMDTPFYAPGMPEDSEHFLAMPEGSTLVGILRETREANTNNPEASSRDKYLYACLETTEGLKFRVKAPGNLKYYVRDVVNPGDLIAITYEGKAFTEKFPAPLGVHQFKVSKISAKNS